MNGARYGWVALAFTAFFTVFFAPALFGGNYMTTPGDGSLLALPAYLAPHGLWEPDIMLGYPASSAFSGAWNPLFLLHLIPHSFNVYMLCAYVIAAIGAFGCVDALTRSTVGGAVAGIAYALGGFMIGHFGHYDIVQAAAWTPCVFWALLVQQQRPDRRSIALGALAIALCATGGQPQVLAYTMVFGVALIVVTAVAHPERRRYVSAATATVVLGAALAAIALAPGIVLTLASFRASASLDYFLAYSEPVWQLPVRLLLPYVTGQSSQPLYPYSATAVGNDAEFAGYAGITTLLLALVAAIVRIRDRNVVFFAVAAIVALLLSAGDGFHIAALTFHVPVLNLFRAQARHMLEFTLFAALLGGIGAAQVAKGAVPARTLGAAIVAVGVAMIAAVIAALQSQALTPGAADVPHNPAFVIPFVVFIGGAAAIVAVNRAAGSRLASIALVAVAIVDLASFGWFAYWRTPVTEAMLQPPPAAIALRTHLQQTHQRAFNVTGATPGIGVPPNLSLVWGVPEAGGYVSLLLTSPGILLQLFPQGTVAPELLANAADTSFNLAAIRYVIAPAAQAPALLAAHKAWRTVSSDPSGTILENTAAEPRVRIVHTVLSMPPDETLAAIRSGSVDTHATAIVAGDGALSTAADPGDRAAIGALEDDRIIVSTTCKNACFLVTSDTYNSLWKATVDGTPVPLRLTDYALRGVAVPAGAHTVIFRYRPWIIAAGGAVSLVALIVVVLLLLPRRRTALSAVPAR